MHGLLPPSDRPYATTFTLSGIRRSPEGSPAETIALQSPMNAHAPIERLEQFRHFLALLAHMKIGSADLCRIDASGVVNATLFTAHQQWDRFRGTNDAELAAWLRGILACNLADEFRRIHRRKRDVARDEPLDVSCTRLLVALQTSPSNKAIRSEHLMRLAWALGELPEDQRNAVELHHLHGCKISEVAELLDRSRPSVAGLLRRGLERLRELLHEPESES